MRQRTKVLVPIGLLAMSAASATACRSAASECGLPPSTVAAGPSSAGDVIGLADRLAAGRLRSVNRQVMPLTGGALRVTAAPGVGLIWIDSTDFGNGVLEADVCGRDVYSESFVGLAFHRRSDDTYEAVYLRPFNFRTSSPDRRQHAVQYVAMPDHDYARLRTASPGEFEKPVDPSVVPAGWNRLRLVVGNGRVQAFVGGAATAALDVRELHSDIRGLVGLYVDNGSDGVFANVRIVKAF
jgi:hypothetical protein